MCTALAIGAHTIQAVVIWGPGATDVIDDNLVITGNTILDPGATFIDALTTNVNVTLTGSFQVEGNGGGPSQLYLFANAGLNINFDLTSFDLTFVGSSNGPLDPLLIVVGGQGTVTFTIRGGRSISFTNQSLTVGLHGGTHLYVYMQTPPTGSPQLFFLRENAAATNLNAFVNIGGSSLISYLSNFPTPGNGDTATIQFIPANTDPTARFVLTIADTGAVIVAGSYTSEPNPNAVTLANIDRTTAAGTNAIFEVVNALGTVAEGGLLVTSSNATPFELLIDPFGTQGAKIDPVGFKGSFDGIRYSFVLGANGTLHVGTQAYFDYVGLANNSCPTGVNLPIKERNWSAFFVDGNLNPNSTPANIILDNPSGLFFRSGVDKNGVVENDINSANPFVVIAGLQTPGAGEIVLDVEGLLNVDGADIGDGIVTKIEILSLQVAPTGGPLITGGLETNFPLRTFAQDCGVYLAYNKAAFLINNLMNLNNTTLDHTDVNHTVLEKDDIHSEPTYIGGEAFSLSCFVPRPAIVFNNSHLLVQSDIAFSGVDLRVPNQQDPTNLICSSNLSKFVFYSNGYCVDMGTGRQMVLGTNIGSKACNTFATISAAAHLDVASTGCCANFNTGLLNELVLTVSTNNSTINPCITTDVTGQTSLHTIFLGDSSNISIGLQACPTCDFASVVPSQLLIDGNYFAIASRGGAFGRPELGGVTGQGVIVVDNQGILAIDPDSIATIDAMIVKRGNGQVLLPEQQVYLGTGFGVTDWMLDLTVTQTIVTPDQSYSDYTINWRSITKDCVSFVPYLISSVNLCNCPPVTENNLFNLPVIQGEVDQLQIQGSRIGDPAEIIVDGGWIRELVFQNEGCPGEAPTAVVIIQNEGRVGLNSAHRDTDSDEAQFVLGVNGVILIANGDGQVDLNTDVIVNNVCAILRGPDFQSGTDTFRINSDSPRVFRVTNTGTLDLRSFLPGDIVEFTGPTSVVFEPGSKMLMNGVTIKFTDNAGITLDPFIKSDLLFQQNTIGPIDNNLAPFVSVNADQPHNAFASLLSLGTGVQNTDSFRVKFIGTGNINLTESSTFFIPLYTFLGVETLIGPGECQIPSTDLSITLSDQSTFMIGDNDTNGGSFQVGNTVPREGHSVNFSIFVQGSDARFLVKPNGFVGFGVGIVDKRLPNANPPDGWFVDNLFNTNNILINLSLGLIQHDRIFAGSDINASLMVFGNSGTESYTLIEEDDGDEATLQRRTGENIKGGGNIAVITSADLAGAAGAISPIVGTQNNNVIVNGITDPRMRVGMLASRIMLEDNAPAGVGADAFFDFLTVDDFTDITSESLGKGVAATGAATFETVRIPLRVGWVFDNAIGRADLFDVADNLGGTMNERRQRASQLGAVNISIDTTQPAPGVFINSQQLE